MAQTTQEVLAEAIVHSTPIAIFYKGRERHVCPYLMGMKGDTLHVLCYQFAGMTSDGSIQFEPPNNRWRCVEVSLVSDVRVLGGEWHGADNYDESTQPCIDRSRIMHRWPGPRRL